MADIRSRLAGQTAYLEPLSNAQFKDAAAWVDIALLITKRYIAILVTHIDDIVQDVFDTQCYAASFEEGYSLNHAGLLVEIDKQKHVDGGDVTKF